NSSIKVPTPGSSLRTPAPGPNVFTSTSVSHRTPSSRRTPHVSSATPGMPPSSVVVAIVEGRGLAKGEIGMASIDLKKPELVLSQIIMPNTACENGNMSTLFKLLSDQLPYTNLSAVQRKYFNEAKGLEYVKQLCVPEYNTVEMEVASNFLITIPLVSECFQALLKYVEFIQNIVYAPYSVKVLFKGSEKTAIIDASTAKNLELIQNARDPKSGHCLYGVLNHTKTAGGARLLRSNVLQPPCVDSNTIHSICLRCAEKQPRIQNKKLKLLAIYTYFLALQLMLNNSSSTAILIVIRKSFWGVFLLSPQEIDSLSINNLLDTYKPYKTGSLNDNRFATIMEKIQTVIHDDTRYQKGTLNMRTQKCFAVKVLKP
ncbi:unnamed protein product, partial [Porites evermanni]